MKRIDTSKLMEGYVNQLSMNHNTECNYKTTLVQFYNFSLGDILNEKYVKSFLESLLDAGKKKKTVENKFYAILGLWNYHNENLTNGHSELDIQLLNAIKRDVLKISIRGAKQAQPELPIDQIAYSVTPECLAPNLSSDIAILKAKLRAVKLSTNEAIVAKQQQIITHELGQCGYNTLTEWLIDRGDALISRLEESNK